MAGLGTGHVTRERLQFVLAGAIVGAAEALFLLVPLAGDTEPERLPWQTDAGTAALLICLGYSVRRRPGIATLILAFASASLAGALENVWTGAASLVQFGDPGGRPMFALASVQVLAHTTVPATVVALYATAPERRLGRWPDTVIWLLAAATAFAAVGRAFFQASIWPPDQYDPWWYPGDNILARFDDLLVIIAIGLLGLVGELRTQGRHHVARQRVVERSPAGPTRGLVIAVIGVAAVWVVAALLYLARPKTELDRFDEVARWVLVPVLLVLVALVASRWSSLLAWMALAGALQTISELVFYRAIAEYIAVVPADATGAGAAAPPIFFVIVALGVLVNVTAFGAMGLALEAATRDGPGDLARQRAWALRAAFAGVVFDAWFGAASFATSGIPWSYLLLVVPVLPVAPVALGLGIWRRLVLAVSEAEAVATRPLQPLRYLETVVSETVSGGSDQRRRAVEAERARLASTLHAEFLPNLERLASRTAAGAPPEEVTERLRELQDEVRRLMSERRLIVLEEFGIVEALEWLVAQAEERVSFPVELTIDDASTPDRPPREVERAAFRIAQLAVENAIQHAGPSRLALHVLARPERLTISVADDGQWVTPAASDRRRDHMGIADMRSEANQVRGAVEVRPSDGGGTTVQFAWPAVATSPARPIDRGAPAPAPGISA